MDDLELVLAYLATPFNVGVTVAFPSLAALGVHALSQYHEPPAHLAAASAILLAPATGIAVKGAWNVTTEEAGRAVALMYTLFAATLLSSMAIYRVFFHRLRHFPGPLSCKLTMWSWPLTDWRGTRFYRIQEMHQRWGDYVRIGPREISVANPDALTAIYGPTGPSAKATRGPWYQAQEMTPNVYSLQTQPKITDHNRRRRDWDPAFSIKALESYQPNILRNTELLLHQFERLSRQGPVDVKEGMLWFGFDMMGELGFGRSFGTLKEAKLSAIVHLVETGARAINAMGNVPYVSYILHLLPSPLKQFEIWLEEAVNWRMAKAEKNELVEADVFAYLLGERGKQRRHLDRKELHQDCMLMVIGGSDTTSNALSFALFELARKPELTQRVRDEICSLFPDGSPIDDFKKLRDEAPLLNACLNESLRLWPPVPSGLQRHIPAPITMSDKVVIPANTVASTHCFTMHRDPRNFYDPENFIPDRWVSDAADDSKPHNVKAFTPFGFGATSCIGKNLAFMEMRAVLAGFLRRFDFSMEPEEMVRFRESIRDQFVAASDAMLMDISLRDKKVA
ncbi:cytochrome P450 [Aspergillus carlsbadensis]|nr:cytochrome P450 [Aspergillus carlsbadensis]